MRSAENLSSARLRLRSPSSRAKSEIRPTHLTQPQQRLDHRKDIVDKSLLRLRNATDVEGDHRFTKNAVSRMLRQAFVFGCVKSRIRSLQILVHDSHVLANNDTILKSQFIEQCSYNKRGAAKINNRRRDRSSPWQSCAIEGLRF